MKLIVISLIYCLIQKKNTNNENIFDIDDRDRRFIILSVSAIMKGNDEYFKRLDKCMYGNAQPFCHKTTGKLQVHTSRPTYIALTSFNCIYSFNCF